MSDWKEIIAMAAAFFGIDILAFKAGLIGGFLSLWYEKKRTPWQAGISILSGAVLAGYLGPMVKEYFHLSDGSASGAAFLLGLGAMRLVPGLLGLAASFAKNPLAFLKRKGNGETKENDGNKSE